MVQTQNKTKNTIQTHSTNKLHNTILHAAEIYTRGIHCKIMLCTHVYYLQYIIYIYYKQIELG